MNAPTEITSGSQKAYVQNGVMYPKTVKLVLTIFSENPSLQVIEISKDSQTYEIKRDGDTVTVTKKGGGGSSDEVLYKKEGADQSENTQLNEALLTIFGATKPNQAYTSLKEGGKKIKADTADGQKKLTLKLTTNNTLERSTVSPYEVPAVKPAVASTPIDISEATAKALVQQQFISPTSDSPPQATKDLPAQFKRIWDEVSTIWSSDDNEDTLTDLNTLSDLQLHAIWNFLELLDPALAKEDVPTDKTEMITGIRKSFERLRDSDNFPSVASTTVTDGDENVPKGWDIYLREEGDPRTTYVSKTLLENILKDSGLKAKIDGIAILNNEADAIAQALSKVGSKIGEGVAGGETAPFRDITAYASARGIPSDDTNLAQQMLAVEYLSITYGTFDDKRKANLGAVEKAWEWGLAHWDGHSFEKSLHAARLLGLENNEAVFRTFFLNNLAFKDESGNMLEADKVIKNILQKLQDKTSPRAALHDLIHDVLPYLKDLLSPIEIVAYAMAHYNLQEGTGLDADHAEFYGDNNKVRDSDKYRGKGFEKAWRVLCDRMDAAAPEYTKGDNINTCKPGMQLYRAVMELGLENNAEVFNHYLRSRVLALNSNATDQELITALATKLGEAIHVDPGTDNTIGVATTTHTIVQAFPDLSSPLYWNDPDAIRSGIPLTDVNAAKVLETGGNKLEKLILEAQLVSKLDGVSNVVVMVVAAKNGENPAGYCLYEYNGAVYTTASTEKITGWDMKYGRAVQAYFTGDRKALNYLAHKIVSEPSSSLASITEENLQVIAFAAPEIVSSPNPGPLTDPEEAMLKEFTGTPLPHGSASPTRSPHRRFKGSISHAHLDAMGRLQALRGNVIDPKGMTVAQFRQWVKDTYGVDVTNAFLRIYAGTTHEAELVDQAKIDEFIDTIHYAIKILKADGMGTDDTAINDLVKKYFVAASFIKISRTKLEEAGEEMVKGIIHGSFSSVQEDGDGGKTINMDKVLRNILGLGATDALTDYKDGDKYKIAKILADYNKQITAEKAKKSSSSPPKPEETEKEKARRLLVAALFTAADLKEGDEPARLNRTELAALALAYYAKGEYIDDVIEDVGSDDDFDPKRIAKFALAGEYKNKKVASKKTSGTGNKSKIEQADKDYKEKQSDFQTTITSATRGEEKWKEPHKKALAEATGKLKMVFDALQTLSETLGEESPFLKEEWERLLSPNSFLLLEIKHLLDKSAQIEDEDGKRSLKATVNELTEMAIEAYQKADIKIKEVDRKENIEKFRKTIQDLQASSAGLSMQKNPLADRFRKIAEESGTEDEYTKAIKAFQTNEMESLIAAAEQQDSENNKKQAFERARRSYVSQIMEAYQAAIETKPEQAATILESLDATLQYIEDKLAVGMEADEPFDPSGIGKARVYRDMATTLMKEGEKSARKHKTRKSLLVEARGLLGKLSTEVGKISADKGMYEKAHTTVVEAYERLALASEDPNDINLASDAAQAWRIPDEDTTQKEKKDTTILSIVGNLANDGPKTPAWYTAAHTFGLTIQKPTERDKASNTVIRHVLSLESKVVKDSAIAHAIRMAGQLQRTDTNKATIEALVQKARSSGWTLKNIKALEKLIEGTKSNPKNYQDFGFKEYSEVDLHGALKNAQVDGEIDALRTELEREIRGILTKAEDEAWKASTLTTALEAFINKAKTGKYAALFTNDDLANLRQLFSKLNKERIFEKNNITLIHTGSVRGPRPSPSE